MMFSHTRLTFLSLTFAAVCACAGVAFGQGATGQITGTVEDSAGAVVPGAGVTVTNLATSLRRETTAGGEGEFAVPLLPPGRYKVEVSAKGFKTVVVPEVEVNVTQTATVNLKLEPSALDETVMVTAEGTLAQQESSQVGRVIESQTIRQLPLPTRNYQQLLALSPGTYSSVANNTELGRGDSVITVNGQRPTSNNVRLNGIDSNSIGTNSTPNIAVPATDSLQEFIVQTSLYDASQGRNAGGNVEAVTRSGGREYHGNLYEFLRNSALNANDFFLNAAGRPRPVLTRNQFGGTFGGPIRLDKFFFFASYQGTRERNGASLNNSISSPFIPAALGDNNRTAAGLSAAFGIPAANINPISVALLSAKLPSGQFAIPSPATASGLTPISAVSTFRENQFNANFDYSFSAGHTLSVKNFFAGNPTRQGNYNFAGLGNGPTRLPGFGGKLSIIQELNSINDTYVFTPNVVNQARFGFSRLRVTSVPEEPFTASQFGIKNPLGNLFPHADADGDGSVHARLVALRRPVVAHQRLHVRRHPLRRQGQPPHTRRGRVPALAGQLLLQRLLARADHLRQLRELPDWRRHLDHRLRRLRPRAARQRPQRLRAGRLEGDAASDAQPGPALRLLRLPG
jgi:hypothetical protein